MQHIAVVEADSYLFKGTVRDNLLLANPAADDAMLQQVIQQVNLHGFLEAQDGLDTRLEEGGRNFSGGQRQRLALARALLHDPSIYIFDEATSNIDAESEEMIMQVIHRLAASKTVLLISHRLANVVDSDQIYMMQDGHIVEHGDHQALMEQGGAYSRLYRKQMELEQYGKEAV